MCRLATASLILAIVVWALPAAAQERIRIDAALSTWDGLDIPDQLYGFRSAPEAERAVRCILNEVGGLQQRNFDTRAANVPNAAAATAPDGCGNRTVPCRRLLLYNPQFMQHIRTQTGNRWSGISIMAHEIGHHLESHTIRPGGSTPPIELEADEFSGWVLRRLGASLDDAQAVYRTFGSQGNSSHPPRGARLTAVAAGWDRAARTGDVNCYAEEEGGGGGPVVGRGRSGGGGGVREDSSGGWRTQLSELIGAYRRAQTAVRRDHGRNNACYRALARLVSGAGRVLLSRVEPDSSDAQQVNSLRVQVEEACPQIYRP